MPGLKCKKCGGQHLTIKCGKNKKNNDTKLYKNNNNKNYNNLKEKFCIKISNIPSDLTIKELYELVKEWGDIGRINFNNNINYKCAFIDFYIKEEAEYFVRALDKTPFDNYIINVDLLARN